LDFFRILQVDPGPPFTLHFEPCSAARYYTVWQADDPNGESTMISGGQNIPGGDCNGSIPVCAPDQGPAFYRIEVRMNPDPVEGGDPDPDPTLLP
jgi:hypothetical protein